LPQVNTSLQAAFTGPVTADDDPIRASMEAPAACLVECVPLPNWRGCV